MAIFLDVNGRVLSKPPVDVPCCGGEGGSPIIAGPRPTRASEVAVVALPDLTAMNSSMKGTKDFRAMRLAGLTPFVDTGIGRPTASPTLIPEFEAAVANVKNLQLPEPTESQGIVICAGGWRFFPSLYVAVKMIRESGCDWPIQVWHFAGRGEFEPRMADLIDDPSVTWMPVESLGLTSPFRVGTPGGWQLKTVAMLHSPFARTIGLDADCYPVRHPIANLVDRPEVVDAGAAFWPDIPSGPGIMTEAHFRALGMQFEDDRNWEVGQMYVDKSRRSNREALWLASWLAFRAESSQYSYGDCGCFQMAFRKLKVNLWMHAGRPKWIDVAFLHMGPDGEPLFVHRCRDKFRLPGNEKSYNTPQTHGELPIVCEFLPKEERAHEYYHELIRKMAT